METRKLQEVGGGTYTVSIPKKWATERGLEAGTRVNLYRCRDGAIVVRSHERDGGTLSTAHVAVGTDRNEVVRTLTAALSVGFNRVTLEADEPFDAETLRAVRSLVRRFVGTEVTTESDRELTVRNLLDASDVSVRQSVVQLQFVACSIHEQATASFVDPDDGLHERLRERDAEAERLCGMVARHFSRALVSLGEADRLGTSRPTLYTYSETARQLRRVARRGVDIARVSERLTGELPDEVTAKLRVVADDTGEAVERASNAAIDGGDAADAHRVLDRCAETRATIEALDEALATGATLASAPATDVVVVARTLDALRRTLDHARAIADVALQDVLRETQG